jgi:hypothetical protein
MTHRTHRLTLLAAAALAAALLAAPAAQAFTFERNASGDAGPGLNYSDPDQNLAPSTQGHGSQFDGNSSTVYRQGGMTMQMYSGNGGGSSFDNRYNADNLFNPFAREGR